MPAEPIVVFDATKPPDYTPVRAVAAEGARVGFSVCNECGSCILLDPDDRIDRQAQHTAWHEGLRRVSSDAHRGGGLIG